jgi:hypothetical protein
MRDGSSFPIRIHAYSCNGFGANQDDCLYRSICITDEFGNVPCRGNIINEEGTKEVFKGRDWKCYCSLTHHCQLEALLFDYWAKPFFLKFLFMRSFFFLDHSCQDQF